MPVRGHTTFHTCAQERRGRKPPAVRDRCKRITIVFVRACGFVISVCVSLTSLTPHQTSGTHCVQCLRCVQYLFVGAMSLCFISSLFIFLYSEKRRNSVQCKNNAPDAPACIAMYKCNVSISKPPSPQHKIE